jgi:Alkylmercury lyase
MSAERGSVRRALEVTGIPAQRWGQARLARLSDAERDLYCWVLRSFADGGTPEPDAACDTARRLGLEPAQALEKLAREDLVHQDPRTGEIAVAYPFSGRPTAHRVHLGSARDVHAMCAVDALGIAFMLGEPTEVVSADPLTKEEIRIWVDPGRRLLWEPEGAAVFAGAQRGDGPSAAVCCAFVNFFASRQSAQRYVRETSAVRGEVLSIPEAAEMGRKIFGDVLATDRIGLNPGR